MKKKNSLLTIRPSPHVLEQKDGLNIFFADDYADDHAKKRYRWLFYKKNKYKDNLI